MSQDLTLYDPPALPALEGEGFDLAPLSSDSLEEMEALVRRLDDGTEFLALVLGIAVVRIEREALWMQAGFPNLQTYRVAQNERLGIPRQTLSRRRKCAEAFIDNRRLFARMDLSGHLSKLQYVPVALKAYDRREVLAHFKADSFREFRAWVLPALPAPALRDVEFAVRDGRMELDGVDLLSFEDELPEEERDFIARTLKAAYRARRGDCLAHVVPVYDQGEARAVDSFLKRYRASR